MWSSSPSQNGILTSLSLAESVTGSSPAARPWRSPAGEECNGM
jgi:hypothetical protein